MTVLLSDICPMEAVFPTFTIPCRYARGHDGDHSYFHLPPGVDAGPLCDECGLIVCVCTDVIPDRQEDCPAEAQIWTTRICTLAQTPDSSLPHFPEEDFDRKD